MGDVSQIRGQFDENGDRGFIVYDDFNCPFSYALNQRLCAMGLDHRVEFRAVQHAPTISSNQADFEILSALISEVAEMRRRAPRIQINVPLFRPNSAAASALVNSVTRIDPIKGRQLRHRIYHSLWIERLDISDPELLDSLLRELEIEAPDDAALQREEWQTWQDEWDSNPEFDRSLPIVISDTGETVVGFPLEPELEAFLQTGSMVSDTLVRGIGDQEELQRILVLDDDVASLQMIVTQMQDAQVEVVRDFARLVDSAVNFGFRGEFRYAGPGHRQYCAIGWRR